MRAQTPHDVLISELVDACMSADPARVKLLVHGVKKLRSGRHLGESPLAAAAKAGCLECAALIAPISPAKALDCRGLDPLCCAVAADDLPMFSLLRPFCDPGFRDARGRSALDWAAMSNSTRCLGALLEGRDDLWSPPPGPLLSDLAPGWRALALAAAAGSIESSLALMKSISAEACEPGPQWLRQTRVAAQAWVRDAEPSVARAREALQAAEAFLEARALRLASQEPAACAARARL